MIVLLTGNPGVGKSTTIASFIRQFPVPQLLGSAFTWVRTDGIPRPEGGRAGFIAVNSAGQQRIISHKTDIDSPVIIGENHVDLEAVDAMFGKVLQNAQRPGAGLTIIDEIGMIQLLSPAFAIELSRAFSDPDIDLLATIHCSDVRLAPYREDPRALCIEVTQANRDVLPAILLTVCTNLSPVHRLSEAQRSQLITMLGDYIAHLRLVQIQKLMCNTVYYVLRGAVTKTGNKLYSVAGDHGSYEVSSAAGTPTCTCDLFNGRGEYVGQAGECSHIQAVLLANA